MQKNTVFVHTNGKQIAGAIVAAHSLKRNSRYPDDFDVRVIKQEDFAFFKEFEGRQFLRAGGRRSWKNDDLQSFTPTRFMPPELMGYQGRAVVIDPDVFAIGDVTELFNRDMQGKAIMAKGRAGHNGRGDYIASSVMLLDCAKLKHWNVKNQFADLFAGKLDYDNWIALASEPRETIGFLESEWNDFDRLTPATKFIHNTKRRTQPWKTGLPIDFTNRVPLIGRFLPENGIRLWGKYKPHPDRRQEAFFFALLKECVDQGKITRQQITAEMRANHVRHDALDLIDRVPPLDQVLSEMRIAV
ncbi:MAG: hypothetical protein HY245_02030 [Rhizobiales bacterium]|nr:hypothetical protein [Hyphomicrobiales bacterium]MBI3672207.1 hypothetical protein [Hyphomicrobiales bacterium]